MLDFRLQVFLSVATKLSFTKASEEMFITQPAVTRHIKELESELEVRLFDRVGNKTFLTPAGELLLSYATQILALHNEAKFEISQLKGNAEGVFRIGASTTIAQYVIPPAPDGYGKFMADIFDVWHKNDIGTIFVQRFETILACYAQYPVRLCSFATVCGDVPVVEKNGDIFRCDHYVRDYKPAGNIKEVRISRAINSADQLEFGINKRDSLPEECLSCEFYFACKGGCPKHRYPEGAGDKSGKYYLCEGKKLFLRHTGDRFERLATQNRLV